MEKFVFCLLILFFYTPIILLWYQDNFRKNLDDISKSVGKVEDVLSDLELTIEDFKYENWKYVVPEVFEEVDNLRYEFENLKSAIDFVYRSY